MTELELHKFVQEKKSEWHKHGEEIFMFVDFSDLDEFTKLISCSKSESAGVECYLKEHSLCVEMIDICEYYGIDPHKIFEGKDSC